MSLSFTFYFCIGRGHHVKHEYHSHVKSTVVKTTEKFKNETLFERTESSSMLTTVSGGKLHQFPIIIMYCPCLQRVKYASWNVTLFEVSNFTLAAEIHGALAQSVDFKE